jgi:Helix-turn-helix domain
MNQTQKDRILNRLRTGVWLSSVEASRDMYIMRLGARIWDLRADGYEIEERKVAGKNWSEYRLRPAAPITLPPAFKEKEFADRQRPLF